MTTKNLGGVFRLGLMYYRAQRHGLTDVQMSNDDTVAVLGEDRIKLIGYAKHNNRYRWERPGFFQRL